MKKTLKELNEKAWYRLVKVVFVLVFIVVLLIFNGLVFTEVGFKNVDQNKTIVECTYKDKLSFSPSEIDVYISDYDLNNGVFDYEDFFDGYNDYDIREILEKCYDPEVEDFDIFIMQRVYEMHPPTDTEEERVFTGAELEELQKIDRAITNSSKITYLDFSVKLFDIQPKYSHTSFALWFTLGNLIIVALSELIRRIFYYILLGSFRPDKKKSTEKANSYER